MSEDEASKFLEILEYNIIDLDIGILINNVGMI
jgi:hypothetical protein